MQLDLPALFFLTLPVYIRANRNPHSLTKLVLTEPAYFRACCVETCCWKIPVPSPCGRISAEPKSRLFITGGKEGLNDVNPGSIQRIHCFERRSFFYFRDSSWDFDRLLVLSALFPLPVPVIVRLSRSFVSPRVDPLGIGKLVVTDISSPGFSYFYRNLSFLFPTTTTLRLQGSFSSRAKFLLLLLLLLLYLLLNRWLDSSILILENTFFSLFFFPE